MPRRIEKSRLLLVEGKCDLHFYDEVIKHLKKCHTEKAEEFDEIQIWIYNGIKNLKNDLEQIHDLREYQNLLSVIGIIADADTNADQRFRSIQSWLKRYDYPSPETQLIPTETNPSVIVLTVPKDGAGMVEGVCLESVKEDPAMKCVNDYFNCLGKTLSDNGLAYPKNDYKAKLQAFLASRKESELNLGTAAQKKCFPFDNIAFNDIKEIILQMVNKG